MTNSKYIRPARREWEKRSNNAIVDYIVVPKLPRNAKIEWQVWAHQGNSRFQCKFLIILNCVNYLKEKVLIFEFHSLLTFSLQMKKLVVVLINDTKRFSADVLITKIQFQL